MQFFETTPTGRIQNLFSRDMDEGNQLLCILFSYRFECHIYTIRTCNILFFSVDVWLPITVESILQNVWIVLFAILFVCLVFPWFIVPLLILAAIYYVISKVFR
jgi:ATP-binding cassette subfamily C (CFTR/MRP) protein 5